MRFPYLKTDRLVAKFIRAHYARTNKLRVYTLQAAHTRERVIM